MGCAGRKSGSPSGEISSAAHAGRGPGREPMPRDRRGRAARAVGACGIVCHVVPLCRVWHVCLAVRDGEYDGDHSRHHKPPSHHVRQKTIQRRQNELGLDRNAPQEGVGDAAVTRCLEFFII